MTAAVDRAGPGAATESEERRLAGRISGLVFALGAASLALLTVLPGVTHAHREALLVIAGGILALGLGQLFAVDRKLAGWWPIHGASVASLALIALVVADTGGAQSPAWVYLFILVVLAGYVYRPRIAAVYLAGAIAVHALPLLYDSRALHSYFLPQFAVAVPAYLALAGATLALKLLMRELRSRAEELAAEQGALRRVATSVAGGDPPELFYELVAHESGWLLSAGAAGILRIDSGDQATVMGSWADHPGGRYPAGTVVPIGSDSDIAAAMRTRCPIRIDEHARGSAVNRLGYSASIVAPILVADQVWGVLAVAAPEPYDLDDDDERRLTQFGALLEIAITSIEDREQLAARAASDALTGLANHRTLRERLAMETARAHRHQTPLSVVVIDVDRFKQINDHGGHEAGDEMLVWVARCLTALARSEDTIARAGGDEFVWLLPDTTRDQALTAVERARVAIAVPAAGRRPITVSAGICDTTVTSDPAELMRGADAALYRSKQLGRDQTWLFEPALETVGDGS
jgi:diguanylate cyclase (GGDEF)-like protein